MSSSPGTGHKIDHHFPHLSVVYIFGGLKDEKLNEEEAGNCPFKTLW